MPKLTCGGCGAAVDVRATDECPYCGRLVSTKPEPAPRMAVPLPRRIELETAPPPSSSRMIFFVGALVAGLGLVGLLTLLGSRPSPSPAPVSPPPPPAVASVTAASPSTVATPSAPTSFAAATVHFGGEGDGPGQFTDPCCIALDKKGNVYVADRTNRTQVMDATGKTLFSLRATTKNVASNPLEGDIDRVQGIAVDSTGRLYVAIGYDILQFSLSLDGDAAPPKLLATFPGKRPKTCYRDLAIDATDTLYARSGCGDTEFAIVKLDTKGKVVARWDEPHDYTKASSDKPAVDGFGNVYVAHVYENLVYSYDSKGAFTGKFGLPDRPHFGNAAIDGNGHLFIRDGGLVRVLGPEGHDFGLLDGSLDHAADVAVDATRAVWVVNQKGVVTRYVLHEP